MSHHLKPLCLPQGNSYPRIFSEVYRMNAINFTARRSRLQRAGERDESARRTMQLIP